MKKRVAFLFPGQGAQYVGMGKDFYQDYPIAKKIFEQADDLLQRNLSRLIFSGPESELTETRNSQPAIYVTSLAMLAVINQYFPHIEPVGCAGLSLGEYTALTAGKFVQFEDGLRLVGYRGMFMHQACEERAGTMAVVLGMADEAVISLVSDLQAPEEIWVANFNCPGQVVISGTNRGIELAKEAALTRGAKRVLPLQVHGAFHSGLMRPAQERLIEYIQNTSFSQSNILLPMNCTGHFAANVEEIRRNLFNQVQMPVYWHKSIQTLTQAGIEHFLEIGCGKTLSGMNKRIGVSAPTTSIETVNDLQQLEIFN